MVRPRDTEIGLKQKHYDALELIEEGDLSIKKIATKTGCNYNELLGLIAGDVLKEGQRASVFEAEVKKINKKKDARIDVLMKRGKELCLEMCGKIVRDIRDKAYINKDDQGMVVKVTTAIGRCQPEIKIDKLQYKYIRGLTAEELISEYKRLEAVATGPSDSRSVQEAEQGRPRTLLGADERGSEPDQGSEDYRLRADAEADGFPPEQMSM